MHCAATLCPPRTVRPRRSVPLLASALRVPLGRARCVCRSRYAARPCAATGTEGRRARSARWSRPGRVRVTITCRPASRLHRRSRCGAAVWPFSVTFCLPVAVFTPARSRRRSPPVSGAPPPPAEGRAPARPRAQHRRCGAAPRSCPPSSRWLAIATTAATGRCARPVATPMPKTRQTARRPRRGPRGTAFTYTQHLRSDRRSGSSTTVTQRSTGATEWRDAG
jgi:hypothetical protein